MRSRRRSSICGDGLNVEAFVAEGLERLERYLAAWARFLELYPNALADRPCTPAVNRGRRRRS